MKKLAWLASFLLITNPGYGFELSGNFWSVGQGSYRVGIDGNSPSGTSWNAAFIAATQEWTKLTAFQFNIENSFHDPCIDREAGQFGDKITGVNFTDDVCGRAFNSSTLAVTLTAGTCFDNSCETGFNIEEADIVFKSSASWDVYEGSRRPGVNDFKRVALHELGHALGLRHEEDVSSIMTALVSDIDSLQADDIAGANAIYQGEGIANSSSFRSIYGIDVVLPSKSLITDTTSFQLTGDLAIGDAELDGKAIDLFQITLLNDSILTVALQSPDFDEFLYVARIDNTQQLVAGGTFVDSSSGTDGNPRISQSFQAGSYWLGVSTDTAGANGSYSIDIATTTTSTARSFSRIQSKAGPLVEINSNPIIAGRLEAGDFDFDGKLIDLYQFDVSTTTRLLVEVGSTDFDAEVIVARILPGESIDPTFFVANQNRFNGQTDAGITRTFTPGTYWVAATSNGAASGAYRVTITVEN